MRDSFKHIYGPVFSWRLGRSLGVDLLSAGKKACTFDCIYCQIGTAHPSASTRRIYVSTKAVVGEIKKLSRVHVDYITFSGSGEPTLAKNLGETIKEALPSTPVVVTGFSNVPHVGEKFVEAESQKKAEERVQRKERKEDESSVVEVEEGQKIVNIILKSGTWFSYNGERMGQGRENSKKFLKDNSELFMKIRNQILEKHGLKPRQEEQSQTSKTSGNESRKAKPVEVTQ